MKKIAAALLIILTLLSAVSCSGSYKPVKSTKEEAKTVMTVSYDGEDYDIKYELYRAFFLNFKNEVDNGNADAWKSDGAEEYIKKINGMIADNSVKIYAAFALAESLGIDVYSKEFDNEIEEYVRIGVEGNGSDIKGHGGDYEKYLVSLKEMNLNYSVSTLLIRYQLALEAINEYYAGKVDEVLGNVGGDFEIKEEDVRNYYFGEECARLLHIFYAEGVKSDGELLSIRDAMSKETDALGVALYIINHSSGLESDLIKNKKVSGMIIGKYAMNDLYYSKYTEAAFSLDSGELSEVIKISGNSGGSYIIYKLDKSEEHFSDNYETIKTSYIDNMIGKKLFDIEEQMKTGINYTKNYDSISHFDISMD